MKDGKVSAPMAAKAGRGTKTNTVVKHEPTHDEIAKRAYEIFLARGEAPGQPEQDWLQAESELRTP